MGLRYRKSINLGGGFRINLSKSGVGYSWGTKGVRFTKKAGGGTRSTYSIPGTGISHVSDSKKHKKSKSVSHSNAANKAIGGSPVILGEERSTNILNLDEVSSAEYNDFLDVINRTLMCDLISCILLWTAILAIAYPLFWLTVIAGIGMQIYIRTQMKIDVEYEFSEEAKQNYTKAYDAWMQIMKCKKVWQIISSQSIQNSKVAGGAGNNLKRVEVKVLSKAPYFLNINMTPFGMKLKGSKIYFLPDKLLIIKGHKAGAVDYKDVKMGIGPNQFLEGISVPRDAKVIGKQWLKVNKNGTPDKRYKDNKQLPICEYGEIQLISGTALNLRIMFSKSDILPEIKESIVLLGEY